MLKRVLSIGVAALVLVSAVVTLQLTAAPASEAVAPPTPVAEFNAPLCEGETDSDPVDGSAPLPGTDDRIDMDLTRVFGQRLTDYNNGRVAVLYDNRGHNYNGFVPSCGTRYVEDIGAVSEWMFCTDKLSHACDRTDSEGTLLNQDGNPIPGQQPVPNNPKLLPEQEKVIAYLIQNGPSYVEFGVALQDASRMNSEARSQLQNLIWRVSDEVAMDDEWGESLCDDNIDAAEQARILTLIPDDPTIELSLAGAGTTLEVGDTADFELTTNLYEQPITVAFSGLSGTPSVISGPAELVGNTLTVHGTDPTEKTTIVLGFTSSAAGSVTLDASAQPASTSHIGWNQSPGIASDGVPCQVFATFNEVDQVMLSESASATFADEAVEETGAFAITKIVSNEADLAVPAEYAVDYECTNGAEGTLTLAPGVGQQISGLPIETECALTEQRTAELTGGTWETPVWSPGDVAGSTYSFTISPESMSHPIAISLTNTLTAVPTDEKPGTEKPTTSDDGSKKPDTDASHGTASPDNAALAVTGSSVMPIVGAAVALLLLGAGLLRMQHRDRVES